MKEKRQLTVEELQQLNTQYFELKTTLKQYREGMRAKGYRKRFNQSQRKNIEAQYKFFKHSINETLITLMDQIGLTKATGADALGNRFVSVGTKWKVLRYFKKQ